MKKILQKQSVFLLALLLLWSKTIFIGFAEFQITLENINQFIILLLNPLPILMIGIALILTRKPAKQTIYLLSFMGFISFLLYANIVYYREFTDFITIPLLLLGGNVSDLGNSIFTLIQWYDFLYFVDIMVVWFFIRKNKQSLSIHLKKFRFTELRTYFALVMIFTIVNIGLANIERPQLLTRTFDRELLVKNVGIYNFHIYDAYLHTNARAQRVFASESELTEINDSMGNDNDIAQRDLHGIAEGKNVIFVAAESLQNFVINNTVNGEEITPFLNELIEDSLYFEEFYHQTAQGKSSDSEFIINNSLFPLPRGAVFFSHASNEYRSMPEILGDEGYFTSSLHANNGSFWNRNVMYKQMGYERFYTQNDYHIDEDNSIGWGLKDIDFMEQSVEHLLEMPQPFYSKLITLTNHFPFDLDEEDMYIDRYDSNSNTLNKYFPTVRYMDESIKVLFEELKENGLYEDSIIVIYGDHDGISTNHNRAMSQYLDKEVTPFVEVELQQVPLIIHVPGMEGEKFSTVAGQIDVRPTLFHLLGIDVEGQTTFGNNLFSEERKELVIRRDGSFITDEAIYTNNTCYLKETGEPTEEALCEPYIEGVNEQLDYSDRIIYGDLLRFDERKNQE